jgi:HAD superfamily hydrolase (TIGR01509 family)
VLKPRAIIFDMDGLMIDSEPLWWRVERQIAKEHGQTWTDELAHACVGKGLPNVIVTMQRELDIPLEVEPGVAQLVETFIARIDELELHRGCLELMAAADAAALPMAVASSSTMNLIRAVLARFEIADRFAATVSGDSVENAKPAPDIFLRAAELLDLPPAECVVLEDSIAGVRAANAAAIPVIAVPEFNVDQFGPLTDHVVDDLHAARALLDI